MTTRNVADAVASELARLDDLAIGEHSGVYEAIYGLLSDGLDAPVQASE